ncbi:MAG TPA: hypothetical protein VF004_09265 [Burkholderiales bacterium]
MPKLILLLALFAFGGIAAAVEEDGFVWVDANTKIRMKPIGSAGSGATKAPEAPKKDKKPEKPKK